MADKDGYVYLANVNEMTEMVEMMAAARSYQNNVEVVNTTRQMLMRTIDIIVRELCDAVKKGKEGRATSAGESPVGDGGRGDGREGRGEGRGDGPGAPRRRSSRSRFRADGGDAVATADAPEGA